MAIKKVIRWTLPALWLIVVFFLSSQPGSDSKELSMRLANQLSMGDATEFLHSFIRSCAHFGIHFILGILTYYAANFSLKKPALATIVLCIPVAIIDELIQFFCPERYLDIFDIALNTGGIFIAIILCKLFMPKPSRL
ncbi:MAG: VanZ family protein [Candidatus Saccharibacteria bacterium]|nr:VanZ family protein [Candidatus Saccharibacteria bacterium]